MVKNLQENKNCDRDRVLKIVKEIWGDDAWGKKQDATETLEKILAEGDKNTIEIHETRTCSVCGQEDGQDTMRTTQIVVTVDRTRMI
jgi:hypothetical protein